MLEAWLFPPTVRVIRVRTFRVRWIGEGLLVAQDVCSRCRPRNFIYLGAWGLAWQSLSMAFFTSCTRNPD